MSLHLPSVRQPDTMHPFFRCSKVGKDWGHNTEVLQLYLQLGFFHTLLVVLVLSTSLAVLNTVTDTLTCPSGPQVSPAEKPGRGAERKRAIFTNTMSPGTQETCFPTVFYLGLIIYIFRNAYNLWTVLLVYRFVSLEHAKDIHAHMGILSHVGNAGMLFFPLWLHNFIKCIDLLYH